MDNEGSSNQQDNDTIHRNSFVQTSTYLALDDAESAYLDAGVG
jgi:hypothetical protein